MPYGFDLILQYKDAADYANRILRGTAVACLPGATANKVWFAINLKAVKGLGLTVPPSLLARADEVIE